MPTTECFRKVSNGFLYVLEGSLVNWELPQTLFMYSDVLGDFGCHEIKFKVTFSPHRKNCLPVVGPF